MGYGSDINGRAAIAKRLLRDIAWMLLVVYAVLAVSLTNFHFIGNDSHTYWVASRDLQYGSGPMTYGAFLYSPVFSQALWPLGHLPWPAFAALVMVTLGLSLAWLLKPLGWWWAVPLWLVGLPEIVSGNIFIPLGVVAVLGLTRPELWAFALLTKITPGVGVVWFLVRRDWRSLGRVVAATVLVAGLSVALSSGPWAEWVQLLTRYLSVASGSLGAPLAPPLAYRLPVGVALVVWGALRDKRWCIPAAMVLCSPVLWLGTLTMLAAVPRLQLAQRKPLRTAASPAPAGAEFTQMSHRVDDNDAPLP